MKGKAVIAITIVAVIALIGTGMATSYGSFLQTDSNTIQYAGTGINILEYNEGEEKWVPMGSSLAVSCPAPSISGSTASFTGQTVTINTYKLDVDCDTTSTVRCWMIFENPLTWALIDSATIRIADGQTKQLIAESEVSGNETARMQSTNPVSFSLARGQYSFTLTITYKDIVINLNDGESSKATEMADLTDSKLVFELQSH